MQSPQWAAAQFQAERKQKKLPTGKLYWDRKRNMWGVIVFEQGVEVVIYPVTPL